MIKYQFLNYKSILLYIEDLNTLNCAVTIDNYDLESLIITYNYEIKNEKIKLNQLDFDKFKNLKKLHVINDNVESFTEAEMHNWYSNYSEYLSSNIITN